jgi:UDP-N-acetylglucosamine 2-epimerase (non-hydrolysing)
MKTKKVVLVIGTRPEAIKMAPLAIALSANSLIQTVILDTGQHKDMTQPALNSFNLKANVTLDVMIAGQSVGELFNRTLFQFNNYLSNNSVDLVLVHGDTGSAAACALSSFFNQVPVGHVEAGLRSGNLLSPWPEEANRMIIDSVATLLFAPTEMARKNVSLARPNAIVENVGNTIVDAVNAGLTIIDNLGPSNVTNEINSYFFDEKFVLVTLHRRENIGLPLDTILDAIEDLANNGKNFVLPVHLNPKVRNQIYARLSNITRVKLIEPLPYLTFLGLLRKSYAVLTDSGGIQEEALSLNIPVLIARDNTERPEGIEAGGAILVGCKSDNIVKSIERLYEDTAFYESMTRSINPYGDGKTSEKIREIVEEFFAI